MMNQERGKPISGFLAGDCKAPSLRGEIASSDRPALTPPYLPITLPSIKVRPTWTATLSYTQNGTWRQAYEV